MRVDYPRKRVVMESVATLLPDDGSILKALRNENNHRSGSRSMKNLNRHSIGPEPLQIKNLAKQIHTEKEQQQYLRRQLIKQSIKQNLFQPAKSASLSIRPTTTCTIRSPTRSRPDTRFSSTRTTAVRPRSQAVRKISELLQNSPNLSPEKPQRQQEQCEEPNIVLGAADILRRLNFSAQLAERKPFLRKGAMVARKVLANLICQSDQIRKQSLQESVFPYNERLIGEYNQVIPAGFQEAGGKEVRKATRIFRGPQPHMKQPNSAFYRTTEVSPVRVESRVSRISRCESTSTYAWRSRVAGWEII